MPGSVLMAAGMGLLAHVTLCVEVGVCLLAAVLAMTLPHSRSVGQ